METIESIERNGFTVNIHPDYDPMSPRDDDNLGEILYPLTSRYVLGDRGASKDEMWEVAGSADNITLPVFAHIHSGVMLNTGGFNDPWDSGQSGIIYCSIEKAKEVWPDLEGDELKVAACKAMKAEVDTYSKFLSGSCYGYTITHELAEEVDSCWGFWSIEDAMEAAKEAADNAEVNENKLKIEKAISHFDEIRELLMGDSYIHAGVALIGSTCGNLRLQLKDILEEL